MTPRALSLLGALVLLIAGGTVFFRHVEGWSWVDAYFFTVVTLSTVGYGTPVPETDLGKIATTVFIFVGLGIFALVIQMVAAYSMRRRKAQGGGLVIGWLTGRRKTRRSHPANEDDRPDPPV